MAIPKKNQAEEEQSPESQLSERYPDSRGRSARSELCQIPDFQCGSRTPCQRNALVWRASLVRWRPISVVERPSQQSNYDSQGSLH